MNKESRFKYFLCGMAMGAADVVPGVSGGTIAFITGIYGRLLDAISAFGLPFLNNLARRNFGKALQEIPWGFLIPLVLGIGLSIISLSKLVLWLLATHPAQQWAFFFGLIISSVLLMQGTVRKSPVTFAFLLAGILAGWSLTGMEALTPASAPHSPAAIFLSGFIALCAMILPGISGSFMLLIMGQYACILNAVVHFSPSVLVPFMAGGLCGLLSFSRVLKFLFRRFPDVSGALLIGLMLGSLRTVWPWQASGSPALPPSIDSSTAVIVLCAVAGTALPIVIQRISSRMNSRKKAG